MERDTLKKGLEITGLPVLLDEVADDDDDLEQMYLTIDGVNHSEVAIDEDIPATYEKAVLTKNTMQWNSAFKKEHDAMISNNVYEWVTEISKIRTSYYQNGCL